MVASCGSGITACTLALGAAILGKEVPVYDVSSIYGHVWSRDLKPRPPGILDRVDPKGSKGHLQVWHQIMRACTPAHYALLIVLLLSWIPLLCS